MRRRISSLNILNDFENGYSNNNSRQKQFGKSCAEEAAKTRLSTLDDRMLLTVDYYVIALDLQIDTLSTDRLTETELNALTIFTSLLALTRSHSCESNDIFLCLLFVCQTQTYSGN